MKRLCVIFFVTVLFSVVYADEKNVDSLITSIDRIWSSINDYTLTLKTFSKKGDKKEESTIEQKFMKPKWIYAKIVDGHSKGSVGVYNPETKKVKGHQGGLLKFVVLTLDPSDKRTLSIRGHRIDQSDCLTLVERLVKYRDKKELTDFSVVTYKDKAAYLFTAEVEDSSELWGANSEKIWIDKNTLYPIHLEQYSAQGEMVHSSTYDNFKVNVGLTEDDFKP